MSEPTSLQDTIIEVLKQDSMPCLETGTLNSDNGEKTSAQDRAYLASWLEGHVDDPIWSKILAAAQTNRPHLSYVWLVWKALKVNRLAESMRSGTDPILELGRKQRQELLELADKADALAAYYRQQEDQEIVAFYAKSFRPVRELNELHQKEAKFFRRRAGEEPKPTAVPIRQDRRQGRSGLRKRRAFICLMSKELDRALWGHKVIDLTDVEAVVAFTRIIFPEVSAEVVRKTLQPTTREGRRQKRAATA